MFVKMKKIMFTFLLGIFISCTPKIEVEAAIESWSNYISPTGGVGDTLYLNDKVQVVYALGSGYSGHYIRGTATIQKNWVDPYCYVKYAGEWYVHLAGYRTDNGVATTGWFKQSEVITSAKLDEISGYIVYGAQGYADDGKFVKGELTSSMYSVSDK